MEFAYVDTYLLCVTVVSSTFSFNYIQFFIQLYYFITKGQTTMTNITSFSVKITNLEKRGLNKPVPHSNGKLKCDKAQPMLSIQCGNDLGQTENLYQ